MDIALAVVARRRHRDLRARYGATHVHAAARGQRRRLLGSHAARSVDRSARAHRHGLVGAERAAQRCVPARARGVIAFGLAVSGSIDASGGAQRDVALAIGLANLQVAGRIQRQVARGGGQVPVGAHAHAGCRRQDRYLARRHGAKGRRVDRQAVGCGGVGAGVVRAGRCRGEARAGRCHQLAPGHHVDLVAGIERGIDADGLRDQVDVADGAFNANTVGISRRRIGDLDAPAFHEETGGGRRIEAARGAGGGQELRHARGQRDLRRIREAGATGIDAARCSNDQSRRPAKDLHGAVDLRGRRTGDLVDDQARWPRHGQIRVRRDLAAKEGAAASRAVVQDQADRIDDERPILVQRDTRRVRPGDPHHRDAALRRARSRSRRDRRLEADRRRRVNDGRCIGLAHAEADRHREVVDRPAHQALSRRPCQHRRRIGRNGACGQHAGCLPRLLERHLQRSQPQRHRHQAGQGTSRHAAAGAFGH